jgi:hypothetical protein
MSVKNLGELRFWKEIDEGVYAVGMMNEENPTANCWVITLWYRIDPYYREEHSHFLEIHGWARGQVVLSLHKKKHADIIARIKRVVEEKPAEEAFQELSKIAFEMAAQVLGERALKVLR